MKKRIITILLVSLLSVCGCAEDEIIEICEVDKSDNLSKADSNDLQAGTIESSYDAGDTCETNNKTDKTAWNIEGDDSKPFVVFVLGEVNKPGVYELPEGARVIEVIEMAGGYTAKACDTYLNLADFVSDAQMIYVPSKEEVSEARNGEKNQLTDIGEAKNNLYSSSSQSEENKLINLNTASKEELMTLPGIGESKAEKIISYRDANGGFSSIEGIMEISGIKEGLFNKIKDKVCVK